MKDKDKLILIKILKYITEIKTFIMRYSYEEFKNDRKTINDCVFNLSQIGELTGKVSEELQIQYQDVEWRGIKALKNRILHDYDGINLSMVWEFLTIELDELKKQLQEIIV